MKTNFVSYLLLVSLFTVQSCWQSSNKKPNSTGNEVSATNVANVDEEKAIQFLKEFYTSYILESDKPDAYCKTFLNIRNKNLTKNLIKTLDELDLDYDPIIQGQDCDKSWLNTLDVNSEAGQKNIFNVCFVVSDNQWECIKLSVVNDNGNYLIDDILNDINLHNDNGSVKQQSNRLNLDDLNMTTWSNECYSDSAINYVYFNVAGASFTFPLHFGMRTTLKQVGDTVIKVYFSYPFILRIPIPDNMQDCRDYAENILIAKIEPIGDKLKFTWYGFYNTKTGKRVHTKNPFDANQKTVILEKCNR